MEARGWLEVCLLFPDTLFTVAGFLLEGPSVKGDVPSVSAGLDLDHITVFFPGLLTDMIS